MKTYKITKNGQTIKANLTRDEALDQLFPIVEDFSSGYRYDNEAETIFNEVDKRVVAVKGDESVKAGNDLFEMVEDGGAGTWKVTIEWNLNGNVPTQERTFDNFDEAYGFYCSEVEDRNLTQFAEYSAAQMDLTAGASGTEWQIKLREI